MIWTIQSRAIDTMIKLLPLLTSPTSICIETFLLLIVVTTQRLEGVFSTNFAIIVAASNGRR